MDNDLQGFLYAQELEKEVNELEKKGKIFFDSADRTSIQTQYQVTQAGSPQALATNKRVITWNIPRLEQIWRSNPYIKRSVAWLSSKPIIKGIDINTQDEKVLSKELAQTQQTISKKLYRQQQKVLEQGFVFGGSAGLFVIKDRQTEADYKQPLLAKTIKKGDFIGIKPLTRWYQIEPALDKGMIWKLGDETGIYDADLLGTPEYYRVELSGGLAGYSGFNENKVRSQGYSISNKRFLVHRSWLWIFNPYALAHIETQVERFWSSSIIETAYVDIERHEMIWSATTKSAIKNNLGIMTIDGLDSMVLNKHTREKIREKINLTKYTTNHGLIVQGSKDKFDFATSNLAGNEKAIEQSMRQVSNALAVPINVNFTSYDKIDPESYLQSLYDMENIQEKDIRQLYNTLIPFVFKSLHGKMISDFSFEFKPITTETPKQKADTMKVMIEVLGKAFEDGAISLVDYQKMLNDLNDNPSNIFHQISKKYIDEVENGDGEGNMITSNSLKIELAKALNQFQQDVNGNKKGLTGVETPASSKGRVNSGGDPTKSSRVFERNPLNREKAKE